VHGRSVALSPIVTACRSSTLHSAATCHGRLFATEASMRILEGLRSCGITVSLSRSPLNDGPDEQPISCLRQELEFGESSGRWLNQTP
jgi:hypothetical protein